MYKKAKIDKSHQHQQDQRHDTGSLDCKTSLTNYTVFICYTKIIFHIKNPPRYPASRNGTNGISVLPFLQNPIIMMPDHTALQIIPIKSVEKNSSGYSTVPSAISSQPSPIPTAPSVRMLISTKRKPHAHKNLRNISSAIYCPHSSADCKYYDQQKRNLLFSDIYP